MLLLFGHHLDADLRRHFSVVADLPADDAEFDIALLANVNAFVEAFRVEQVAVEANYNK